MIIIVIIIKIIIIKRTIIQKTIEYLCISIFLMVKTLRQS